MLERAGDGSGSCSDQWQIISEVNSTVCKANSTHARQTLLAPDAKSRQQK